MSRTARLLELMIKVRTKTHFTVEEMAGEFGVSRRTMLRDLHALSEMGVPLAARPGPYGGYSLIAGGRMLPLTLLVDEAIGLVLSYESFLQYDESPFAEQSLSAITKLRNAIPPDVVQQLDRIHRHVAIMEPRRGYQAPLLAEMLQAAVDGVHLQVVYESRSGVSERLIFPLGLYAADGFWYVACYDYRREIMVSLRADRFRSLERVPGRQPPTEQTLRDYLAAWRSGATDMIRLRARVNRQAARSFQMNTVFGDVPVNDHGIGVLDTMVPESELEFYAAQLLALGPDVVVEEPASLVEAMRRRAAEVVALYAG